MSIRPELYPDWATDTENNGSLNSPNKTQPTQNKLDKGWNFPEKPPRGEFNWWMNKVGEWVRYLINPSYTLRADTYTAVAGDKILPDNSVSSLTISLPATPETGDSVYFRQVVDQPYSAFGLTIGRNGSTIMGLSEDMTVGVGADDIEFIMAYNGSTWVVYKDLAVGTTL